jgi:hypothetical protein
MVFYVSKDDGAVVAIAAASGVPTEIDATNAKGCYKIALAQAETNADKLLFSGKSSTANVVVAPAVIYTLPPNFTKVPIDSGTGAVSSNPILWTGGTIPAPATAGIPDMNVKNYNNHTAVTDPNNYPSVNVVDKGGVAAFGAAGYFGIDWSQITNPTSSQPNVNVSYWFGNPVPSPNQAGVPLVDVKYWLGSIVIASTPGVPVANASRSATCQTGSTASTLKLDASASATNNIYNGSQASIISGTGAGQTGRVVFSYVGSTRVASISPNWAVTPDNTSVFALTPAGSDVEAVFGGQIGTSAPGYMSIDWATVVNQSSSVNLSGTTIGNVTTCFGVNGNVTGSVGSVAGNVVGSVGSVVGNVGGSVGSVAGGVGGSIGGNVAGTVGGISGVTFPIRFGSLAITVAGGVTLGDGVAHGGTPGSSTATLALSQVLWKGVTDNVATFEVRHESAGGGDSFKIYNNSTSYPGITVLGQGGASAFLIGGPSACIDAQGGNAIPALLLRGPALTPGPAVVIDNSTASGYAGGVAVQIKTNNGDALNLFSSGSNKHDINLAGSHDILGNLNGSVFGNLQGNVAGDVNGRLVGGGSTIFVGVGAQVALTSSGLDAVALETGINARQGLSLILAGSSCGNLSGAPNGPIIIYAAGNPATVRITGTVDGVGNRTSVVLSPPP